MPMPSLSLSDLKGKALQAKDYSATRISRLSSPASKNLNWDTSKPPPPPPPPKKVEKTSHTKTQPPPPPHPSSRQSSLDIARPAAAEHSRTHSTLSESTPPPSPARAASHRPPPLARREARPDSASPTSSRSQSIQSVQQQETDRIDWANLSREDKQVFFSWLDEFFVQYPNRTVSSKGNQGDVSHEDPPYVPPPRAPPARRPAPQAAFPAPHAATGPPAIPMATRPKQPSSLPTNGSPESITSYPPPTQFGSAALDLAQYFTSSMHWDSPWYMNDSPMPPPLHGSDQIAFTASWEMHSSSKTLYGGVLFADLSMCWFSVQFSANAHADPSDTRAVQRSAQYLPRPAALDQAVLVEAHETYGETIAAFAESFEGTGQYCGRGECWDLADGALKYFEQYDYVPKPVPSISRTHGHLIFEGRAADKGRTQSGQWHGGDDRVRRGDIVEWRSARIGMGRGGFAILGSPDHTAVVVSDAVPLNAVGDGASLKPSDLGNLEVVEQSVGKPPARALYDLEGLEEGEIWIYRPVGMLTYVGSLLEAKCPEGVSAWSV